MLMDPTFDMKCPNPDCQGTLKVTRSHLSAGAVPCETCGENIGLTGDAASIAESLDRLEASLEGLGFKG